MKKEFITVLFSKAYICLVILVALQINVFSQETPNNKTFLLRPYIENGVDFIRNDYLKQNYVTESKYYFGGGLQIGLPYSEKFIPFGQFTYSLYTVKKEIIPTVKTFDTLQTQQTTIGVILPFYKVTQGMYVRSKFGLSYAKLNETIYSGRTKSYGFLLGIGLEKTLQNSISRVFIDLSYNYQKANKAMFKDYDVTKLSFGVVF